MYHFNLMESKVKLAKALDDKDEYTMEDFCAEYGQTTISTEYPKQQITFVNESKNEDPNWETTGSAGFDLRANEGGFIKPKEFQVIKTGLYFDLPENTEIQIRPRSGLAAKQGVTVLNSPGTIDSDYTGEIGVILINHGKKPFFFSKGDRIAQAVIGAVAGKSVLKLKRVESIDKDTDRGAGGFGSTGVK